MTVILVIDDEKDTTELLAMALTGEDYKVIETTSGAMAPQLALQHKPDVIILDLMMPDVGGLEVCKIIRGQRETAHIPILMLSALADVDYKVLAFDAGADDYLSKPVQFAELKSRLQVLIKRRVQEQAAVGARGKVIAILGAGGGVGVSTTVLNLGAAWAEKYPQTVIAELTPGTGNLAPALGLSPSRALSELLALGERQYSQDKIRRQIQEAVIDGPHGLKLLPSEQNARLAMHFEPWSSESVEEVVLSLAEAYDFVLLDLGHGYNARARAACPIANWVLVVARAETLSLQAAIQQVKLIEESGVPQERIHTIMAAFHKAPYALGPEQARQIFRQQKAPYNVLLGLPPMVDLIHKAQEARQAVVSLEPQGDKLRTYLQEALEKIIQ